MTLDEEHDASRCLSGSPVRVSVFRALDDGVRQPAALTASVDASRTTVHRILSDYRDRSWVVRRNGDYYLTPTGERVYDAYETFLAEVALADQLATFSADLARAGAGFPAEAIDRGDLTTAANRNPFAVLDRIVELFEDAGGHEIRAVSPIVTTRYNNAAAAALDDGARIRLVIDEGVLETSRAEFSDATRRALTDDGVDVYIAAERIQYGVFTLDDRACVVSYDDANNPSGLLESSDPLVREWVLDRYERFQSAATPIADCLPE